MNSNSSNLETSESPVILVVIDHHDNSVTPTWLKKDDELIFDTLNNTVTMKRASISKLNKQIKFQLFPGMFDDKRIAKFETTEEIIKACSLLASFLGLKAELVSFTGMIKSMVYVKLV
jgi:hypothetical protein